MKKITATIYCLLIIFALYAQDKTKVFKGFGIFVSTEFDNSKVTASNWDDINISSELNTLTKDGITGFSLGENMEFRTGSQTSIITGITLSFDAFRLNYDFENSPDYTEDVEIIGLSIPIQYVFMRHKNEKINPFASIGGRYFRDITSRKDEQKINLNRNNINADASIGIEWRLNSKFAIKPELLYSIGLLELHNDSSNIYNAAIMNVYHRRLIFKLAFTQ